MKYLMSDVYDYLFENDFSIGTNFCDEFPESWIDEETNTVYLAKKEGISLYKITLEKV